MRVKANEKTKNIFDSVRNVMFTPGEEFEVTEERYNEIKEYVEVVETDTKCTKNEENESKKGTKSVKKGKKNE